MSASSGSSGSSKAKSGPPELNREEAARLRKRFLDQQAAIAKESGGNDNTQHDSEDTAIANFILPGD